MCHSIRRKEGRFRVCGGRRVTNSRPDPVNSIPESGLFLVNGNGPRRASGEERSVSQLQNDVNRMASRRQIMGTVVALGIPSLAGCNSVLGDPKADRLLENYEEGYSKYNTGTEIHNNAVLKYRGDEYEQVIQLIEDALAPLKQAKNAFETCRGLAQDLDNQDALSIVSSALDQTRLLIEASELLRETAKGFKNEQYESAQSSYDSYKVTAAELSNSNLTDPRVFEQVLDQGLLDF